MVKLLSVNFLRLGATGYPYCLRLEVELGGAHFKLSLSSSECGRIVRELQLSYAVADDVSGHWVALDVWVPFELLDLVFKINWAVTFNNDFLGIVLADFASLAHVELLGYQLILLGVNHRESVDWDQYLVALTMDPNCVVEVFEFVVRSKLDINVFTDP